MGTTAVCLACYHRTRIGGFSVSETLRLLVCGGIDRGHRGRLSCLLQNQLCRQRHDVTDYSSVAFVRNSSGGGGIRYYRST